MVSRNPPGSSLRGRLVPVGLGIQPTLAREQDHQHFLAGTFHVVPFAGQSLQGLGIVQNGVDPTLEVGIGGLQLVGVAAEFAGRGGGHEGEGGYIRLSEYLHINTFAET